MNKHAELDQLLVEKYGDERENFLKFKKSKGLCENVKAYREEKHELVKDLHKSDEQTSRKAFPVNDIAAGGLSQNHAVPKQENENHENVFNIAKECVEPSNQWYSTMDQTYKKANLMEEIEMNEGNNMKTAMIEKQRKESISQQEYETESLHRTLRGEALSEIDWHELTKFAQGESFDPESSIAREIENIIVQGKDELSVAFKMIQKMDLDVVVEKTEECVQCVFNTGWRVVSHWELPHWLRDNDFLWHMHRPQLPSFKECFCSMFRIHTETGNIWTHFFGLILVLISMLFMYLRPVTMLGDFPHGWEEYLVFGAFFIGTIACLTFSWLYHTCLCHSKKTSAIFCKMDYTGIVCMVVGSYVPFIYYSFYCRFYEKISYIIVELVLGIMCTTVALWDKFATPAFRAIRAALFLALGSSAVVPVTHMMILDGFQEGFRKGQVSWLLIMAFCYILGTLLYAMRIPERYFPGKCNLVFQSHQILHVMVVVGAFIYLHGCCEMALYRIRVGRNCSMESAVNISLSNSNVSLSL